MTTVQSSLPPPDAALLPPLRRIGFDAPWRWLGAGWADLRATGFRGLVYGVAFALMGWLVALVYKDYWKLTAGLTTGFFLMGPFVCCGLYWLSRQRERGEPISLAASAVCWRRNARSIAFFAVMLAFLLMVWSRISLVVFALFSTHEFPTMQGVMAKIFSFSNFDFLLAWFAVGFVFAAVAFAMTVVSMPMMLDRGTDSIVALLTSVACVGNNIGPMLLWAAMIVVLIGVGIALGFVGLIFTAPLVGHASWHAYRELVGEKQPPAGGPQVSAGKARRR